MGKKHYKDDDRVYDGIQFSRCGLFFVNDDQMDTKDRSFTPFPEDITCGNCKRIIKSLMTKAKETNDD